MSEFLFKKILKFEPKSESQMAWLTVIVRLFNLCAVARSNCADIFIMFLQLEIKNMEEIST